MSDELKVNQHFWAEVDPLQYHVREQCAVHSIAPGENKSPHGTKYGTMFAAKLVVGDVTIYLDDTNALRVAQALTSSVIHGRRVIGQQ